MTITVYFKAIDGTRGSRRFSTIAAARRHALGILGATHEIRSSYAISGDGIVRVRVAGATMAQLLNDAPAAPAPGRYVVLHVFPTYGDRDELTGTVARPVFHSDDEEHAAMTLADLQDRRDGWDESYHCGATWDGSNYVRWPVLTSNGWAQPTDEIPF